MVDDVVIEAPRRSVWRLFHRPYFFEIFTIGNLLLIHFLLMYRFGLPGALDSLPLMLGSLIPLTIGQLVAGVVLRVGWFAWRDRAAMHAYLLRVRSAKWLIDSARLVLFVTLTIHTYSWIKLTVPLLHPRLFDQQLWDLDATMFFGMSPTIFFLSLFSTGSALRAVDFSYAWFFVASINIAFVYFLSAPERRLRVAFNDGNTLLWLSGAWLYVALPSIGPAFRFPQVWFAVADQLAHTHELQTMLMHNYQMVTHPHITQEKAINILLGVAAFPSLHVGFMTFMFLWMRRLSRPIGLVFGIFTLFICIGSIVTGWHYLIDAIAGLVLAVFTYAAAARFHRFGRWLQLREIVNR
jgi:membrane-associated phospholipid phosphatase